MSKNQFETLYNRVRLKEDETWMDDLVTAWFGGCLTGNQRELLLVVL